MTVDADEASDRSVDPDGRVGHIEPWQTMALAGIAAISLWIGLVASWGDAPFTLTFDDAYYFFEIGANLADGHGFTFDRINETNGFMPLWQLLCVPVFALGFEGETAARILLVAQLVMWAGATAVIARTAGSASAGLPRIIEKGRESAVAPVTVVAALSFAAIVGSPYVLKGLSSGLESGVTDLMYALLLYEAVRSRGDLAFSTTRRRRIGISVLLGMLFLGRTDVVVLLAIMGAFSLWTLRVSAKEAGPGGGLERSALQGEADSAGGDTAGGYLDSSDLDPSDSGDSDSSGSDSARGEPALDIAASRARNLAELFTLPGLVIVAYTVWNQLVFGIPVQISGVVKRVDVGGQQVVGMTAALCLGLFIASRSWRSRVSLLANGPGRFPRVQVIWASTGWFAAFLAVVTGYYQFLSAQQWLWYFAPHIVYLILLGAAAVLDFAEAAVVEAPRRHSTARALSPVLFVFVLPVLASLPLQWQSFADPDLRSIQLANKQAGIWITENLPSETVLGSWDAGVVGFFSDQSVVNLDGVVNSLDWHRAVEAGTTGEFLREAGVTHIVNHGPLVEGEEPEIDKQVQRLFGDPDARAIQVHRVEFTYAGRFEGSSQGVEGGKMAVFIHRVDSPA